MAPRTVIPVVQLPGGTSVDEVLGGTELDPTNGHVLAPHIERDMILVIAESTAGAVTIKAGTKQPAESGGQGDLVVNPSTTQRTMVGPFESARFDQGDGTLNIDVAGGAVGDVWAYEIPK